MKQPTMACVILLALAGCATAPRGVRENPLQPSAPESGYVPETQYDAATIERMRTAPAPAIPNVALGTNPLGDQQHLTAQGYVLLGKGHFPGAEGGVRDQAIGQGQRIGAERILLYAPPNGAASPAEWQASYFVRFQLPFGATFRDLHADERRKFGTEGGVEIGSVIGGTPASRANLRRGDIVLKFDGKPVLDRSAFQNLLKSRAGHPVTLTIVRNGETLQRVVRLGEMAH